MDLSLADPTYSWTLLRLAAWASYFDDGEYYKVLWLAIAERGRSERNDIPVPNEWF